MPASIRSRPSPVAPVVPEPVSITSSPSPVPSARSPNTTVRRGARAQVVVARSADGSHWDGQPRRVEAVVAGGEVDVDESETTGAGWWFECRADDPVRRLHLDADALPRPRRRRTKSIPGLPTISSVSPFTVTDEPRCRVTVVGALVVVPSLAV